MSWINKRFLGKSRLLLLQLICFSLNNIFIVFHCWNGAVFLSICPQLHCLAFGHMGCFEIFMTLWFVMVGIFLFWWLHGANTVSGLRLHTQIQNNKKNTRSITGTRPKRHAVCAQTTFLRSPPWQYSIARSGNSLVAISAFIPGGTSLAATTLSWFNLREKAPAGVSLTYCR